ncbi:MAG: hydroxymethylglutaryl-CoA synthase family protein [Promethearchaeota archaeon]
MISNEYLFTNIGIDSVGFHAPRNYLDLGELALKRQIDPDKLKKGLLLNEMRFPEVDEDIISIGLKAGYNALAKGNIDPKEIDAVFVGTETMTYAVKSVSNIFAELLGVSPNSMTQDVYNACAAGTLALLNAISLIEKDVINKALVINADISSYELGSPGEPTQGCGATAFVISKNPRVAAFSKKFGTVSGNVNDFYRHANEINAQVPNGKYSVDAYLNFQLRAYDDLVDKIGNFYADYYTFHAPYSKLPLKCMQEIIYKRWIHDIKRVSNIDREQITDSLFQKLDSFLHNISVVPEYIYLKLKEKGFGSSKLEKISNWLISSVKGRALPQLRVPMHFGNLYSAALWAQIIYILENHARRNDTIYFGSYGSGATCISGLLKVRHQFNSVLENGPKIVDYINDKQRKSVKEYELIKNGVLKPQIHIGRVIEHELNENRGFTLYFCDEGCIIPNIKGLNYCPNGHSGYHKMVFPLYAVLKSKPMLNPNINDLTYLIKGFVRVAPEAKRGNSLEYEMRRVVIENESDRKITGSLNWAPMYVPVHTFY